MSSSAKLFFIRLKVLKHPESPPSLELFIRLVTNKKLLLLYICANKEKPFGGVKKGCEMGKWVFWPKNPNPCLK